MLKRWEREDGTVDDGRRRRCSLAGDVVKEREKRETSKCCHGWDVVVALLVEDVDSGGCCWVPASGYGRMGG